MDVATALRQGTEILEKDSISAPRLTAEVLLARAIGCERVDLYAHPERELARVEQVHFGRYLHERLQRKPTQYITGEQEFYGRVFRVTSAALIPRPETELVVETALRLAVGPEGARLRILDVGTGSGCLAITLAKEMPGAVIWASDVSRGALGLAHENARRLEARVHFFCADLLEACGGPGLDLIVSNPPYVPEEEMDGLPPEVRDYEPRAALHGGRGGAEFYGRLLEGAERTLRPGGWLIAELGYDTRRRVEPLLGEGWTKRRFEADLAGFDRVMAVRRGDAVP